jgi:hypothetical protein
MRVLLAAAALVALAGCSGTKIEQQGWQYEFPVSRNYQAVYADTYATMRGCLQPGATSLTGSRVTTLYHDLYPDLGYGELRNGAAGMLVETYSVTRIERAGSGSVVRIKVNMPGELRKGSTARWLAYWAKGGKTCPRLGALDPPA